MSIVVFGIGNPIGKQMFELCKDTSVFYEPIDIRKVMPADPRRRYKIKHEFNSDHISIQTALLDDKKIFGAVTRVCELVERHTFHEDGV